ncbi:hypothetical protein M413DRAFT_147187 [Hebeloma cylindrosporum]|uniref:Uncharacterized protein n=1 Tax=Hebeloma cylindrosporum TaxID=76867 RepID=A0A0C2XUM4_HEBCY|nr:hypothetical protein M413DRAFT_147187 [Hebeloma cylindrosporum h7]
MLEGSGVRSQDNDEIRKLPQRESSEHNPRTPAVQQKIIEFRALVPDCCMGCCPLVNLLFII